MSSNMTAFIYGLIMMILTFIVNFLLANVFNIDIIILFLCNIITLLSMIWYKLSTKRSDKE